MACVLASPPRAITAEIHRERTLANAADEPRRNQQLGGVGVGHFPVCGECAWLRNGLTLIVRDRAGNATKCRQTASTLATRAVMRAKIKFIIPVS